MDKHPLQTLLESIGIEGVRSYSGRAMYGKECLGVDLDRGSLGRFIGDVIEGIANYYDADADSDDDSRFVGEIAQVFRQMTQDQMGLGIIVYFPGVPYVGDEEDE